jgi:SAM-dependent methyltransferase
MTDFSLPPSDEPFDFRHQAAVYGQHRRDYSAALYDAIAAHTGPGGGRQAIDLGCGTGFVTRALATRGWHVVGVDFSGPMLAAARAASPALHLVRGSADALPLREGVAALLTCGTAFHWFRPVPALAEIERVLAPGGWAALFWRYPVPGQAHTRLVSEVLRRIGVELPDGFEEIQVHPAEPFAGSRLRAEPVRHIESTLEFTAAGFQGYIGTVEWLRRLTGPRHSAFLTALGDELAQHFPGGFRERCQEYLFLGHKAVG